METDDCPLLDEDETDDCPLFSFAIQSSSRCFLFLFFLVFNLRVTFGELKKQLRTGCLSILMILMFLTPLAEFTP